MKEEGQLRQTHCHTHTHIYTQIQMLLWTLINQYYCLGTTYCVHMVLKKNRLSTMCWKPINLNVVCFYVTEMFLSMSDL